MRVLRRITAIANTIAAAAAVTAAFGCLPCLAQQAAEPSAAAPEKTAKPAAAKPAAPKPGAKPAAKATRGTEFEVTALTSEITDQFYGRALYNQSRGPRKAFVRGGYSLTKSRTYTATKVNTSRLVNYTFDGQYRRDRKRTYHFYTAKANVRDRTPYSVTYGDRSGYYMFSTGVGRRLWDGVEGEIGLAAIRRLDTEDYTRLEPVYALRAQKQISTAMRLDGEAHLVDLFDSRPTIDSRTSLTYKFAPSLSLRLTYIANNLIPSPGSRTGWDKSFRISVVFSRPGK